MAEKQLFIFILFLVSKTKNKKYKNRTQIFKNLCKIRKKMFTVWKFFVNFVQKIHQFRPKFPFLGVYIFPVLFPFSRSKMTGNGKGNSRRLKIKTGTGIPVPGVKKHREIRENGKRERETAAPLVYI